MVRSGCGRTWWITPRWEAGGGDLGCTAGFINAIEVYAPKRDERVNLANPAAAFNRGYLQIGGVFTLNSPDYDDQMVIVPITLAGSCFTIPTR